MHSSKLPSNLRRLILIDGGWLQGMASPALVHTTVGRMLFHVFVEEIGEGKAQEHHANIYRNLIAAMAVTPPPVDTWEFARWPRLQGFVLRSAYAVAKYFLFSAALSA